MRSPGGDWVFRYLANFSVSVRMNPSICCYPLRQQLFVLAVLFDPIEQHRFPG